MLWSYVKHLLWISKPEARDEVWEVMTRDLWKVRLT